MAEGWARSLLSDKCVSYSAGIHARGLDSIAIEVMAEVGIDITMQLSQTIDSLPKVAWDLVVTVCDNARESCPVLPGVALTVHHSFDDPPALSLGCSEAETREIYRRVRDEIKRFVEALPTYLVPVAQSA